MSRDVDHYAVLGVAPGSPQAVIEAAYHALMQRYAPDAHRSVNAAKKRADLEAAFKVLSDPKSRTTYDQKHGYRPHKVVAAPPVPRPEDVRTNAAYVPAAPRKGVHPALWVVGVLGLLVFVGIASVPDSPAGSTNSALNVDENMMTTDMNVARDMNAANEANAVDSNTTLMNATEANAVDENTMATDAGPYDLSRQIQAAVTFASIESASNWSATVLKASGFPGARASSERCHLDVQNNPTWSGADRCAAFDYAAAHVDDLIARSGRGSTHAYFQFARENQADNYTAVGAPSYALTGRLAEIRRAAEAAIIETIQASAPKPTPAPPEPAPSAAPSPPQSYSNPPGRIRAVPEGVFLDRETRLGDGTKRCVFNNGYERVIPVAGDCFSR